MRRKRGAALCWFLQGITKSPIRRFTFNNMGSFLMFITTKVKGQLLSKSLLIQEK